MAATLSNSSYALTKIYKLILFSHYWNTELLILFLTNPALYTQGSSATICTLSSSYMFLPIALDKKTHPENATTLESITNTLRVT